MFETRQRHGTVAAHGARGAADAGGIDVDVNGSETLASRGDGGGYRIFVGDVARAPDRPLAEFGPRLAQQLAIAVEQHDIGACREKIPGNRQAKARGAAGDERRFSRQFHFQIRPVCARLQA